MEADVTQPHQVSTAVARIEQDLGSVDMLVNNAGVGMESPLGQIDSAIAHHLFDVNFWGALTCIEAVLPSMQARRQGLIINISSILGRRAMPRDSIYCASKFALDALSDSIRLELRPYNIRVVTFYPGVTATDMTQHTLTGDASHRSRRLVPRTPVARTAEAIVSAAQREPRDAFATLFDRVFVWGAALAPSVFDGLLARFYGPDGLTD